MAGDGHAGTWVVVYVGVREGMRSVFFGGGVGGGGGPAAQQQAPRPCTEACRAQPSQNFQSVLGPGQVTKLPVLQKTLEDSIGSCAEDRPTLCGLKPKQLWLADKQ